VQHYHELMALWESAVLSATIARAYGRFEASCLFCFYAWLAGNHLKRCRLWATVPKYSHRSVWTTQRSLQHPPAQYTALDRTIGKYPCSVQCGLGSQSALSALQGTRRRRWQRPS
jgi:hypothetical protein